MNIENSHLLQALAETIKRLRQEHHFSQSELAHKSGLTADYISKLERGKKQNPTLATLFKLAYVFELSATDLMHRIENPHSK